MNALVGVEKVRQRLQTFDWSLVKGSMLLSIGSVAARALAMVFWLILARAFTPDDYGSVQYSITLGMIVASFTQPFGQHVLSRYIGKYQNNQENLHNNLGTLWILLIVLTGVTVLVGVPVLLVVGKFDIGIMAVFVGITVFYAYCGLASGFMSPSRLTIAYLGSNVVQLILTFGLINLLEIKSTLVAVLIYGLSYFLPIGLLQMVKPLPIVIKTFRINMTVAADVLSFSWPIWISHISYTLYAAMPFLLLEHFVSKASVGIFSLATTLTSIFGIINGSVATLLMPKSANLPPQERKKLLIRILMLLLALNSMLLLVYVLLLEWVVRSLFSAEYLSSLSTYIILALGMLVMGSYGLISAVMIGGGQVRQEAISRIAALLVTGVVGWVLIPLYADLGAAIAILSGTLGAMFLLGLFALIGKRKHIHSFAE